MFVMKLAALLLSLAVLGSFGLLVVTGAWKPSSHPFRDDSSAEAYPKADVYCGKEEAKCLRQLTRIATRQGDVLRLRLTNGIDKDLVTTKVCREGTFDGCVQYRLYGFYAKDRLFLVDAGNLTDGGQLFLVSSRTGKELNVDRDVHYSATGRWLAAVSATETVGENSIEIWSSTGDVPRPEWRYVVPADEYALYQFVSWDGDDRLKMKVAMHVNGELVEDIEVEVVHERDGWKLLPPKIN
jgi:hypothetical protein